jgi:hypothetical protein
MTKVPDKFAGTIVIEWPQPASGALHGYKLKISTEDGRPVLTVMNLAVHSAADSLVWAEMMMFADRDGNPVYDHPVYQHDGGELITGTFPFRVAEMRVAAESGTAVFAHGEQDIL